MLQLANGKQQFLDQNGAPLAGGLVYHYAPGTTNPVTTYKDPAGSAANKNPVPLDSRGQAVIWGAGTFRQVVTDAFGNLIWDQLVNAPDVNAAADGLEGRLAAQSGSTRVGFAQAGPGAITQTVHDALIERVTFRQFGAVGDGLADDTSAMQRAINYAASRPNAQVSGGSGDKHKISAGLVVPFDGKFQDPTSAVTLDFTGTQIIPASGGIVCVKAARDFVTIINPTVVNSGGFANIIAYGVMPEDVTQATTQVSQQFCRIVSPVAVGVDVLIKQMPGPTVTGAASGSFYNTYENPTGRNVKCLIWLAGNPNALDVLNTRTTIRNPTHVGGNCTFWGEACDTTNVEGGSAENITVGTWPFATPTTIKIPQKFPGHALDNNSVRFHGFVGETGVIPYDIGAFYCPMPNCSFIGYTQPSVGDQSRTQWSNRGGVGSTTDAAGKLALLSAKIDGGSAAGKQAYLGLDGAGSNPAELYSDTGFTSVSRMDFGDLRSTRVGGQRLGGDGIELTVGGGGPRILLYNLSSTGDGILELGGNTNVQPDRDGLCALGGPANHWSSVFASTGSINTSDERMKQEIGPIDPAALRAVARINFVQFKFGDAIERKGDGARWHYGVIAQQVKEAFEAEGLTAFNYGLLCYDEWTDQYEPVIAEREVVRSDPDGQPQTITETYRTGEMQLVRAAGNRYGIRYDELYALALACLFSRPA